MAGLFPSLTLWVEAENITGHFLEHSLLLRPFSFFFFFYLSMKTDVLKQNLA